MDKIEHLLLGGVPALVDAVLGQRLRGAAATLVQRREEPATRADLLQLHGVHACHPCSPEQGVTSAVYERAPGQADTRCGQPSDLPGSGPASVVSAAGSDGAEVGDRCP